MRLADLLPEDLVIDMKVAIVFGKRHEKSIVVFDDSANDPFGLQHEENLFAKYPITSSPASAKPDLLYPGLANESDARPCY